MDPMSILFPVLSVGGMGVVFGACLGVARLKKTLVSVRFWNVCPALTAVVVVSPVVVVVHLQSLPVQLL